MPDTDNIVSGRRIRVVAKLAADANYSHDEEVLEAIRETGSRLRQIHGQRLWMDVERLIANNKPDVVQGIMKTMLEVGLAPHLGEYRRGGQPYETALVKLHADVCSSGFGVDSDELNITYFNSICEKAAKYKFEAVTFIAALCKTKDQVSARINLALDCQNGQKVYVPLHA